MIQNFQHQRLLLKLQNVILFGGIIVIICLSSKYSYAQTESGSFEFEGLTRNYIVFLPQNYQPDMPVVFNLHGYTYDAAWHVDYTLMNEVADTAGFVVVYPNAVYPGFNGGVWIPGPPQLDTTINDIGFISALIDTITAHYEIDTNRIYCCGLSNGGQMTYRLTCQLGHRFAAVASVSGLVSDISTADCLSNPPMPILHFHGTADDIVPYEGSTYQWSVEETLNLWLEKNGCTLPADTVFLPDLDPTDGCTVQKISYTNCEDNSCLIFYKVIDGGHSWPGAPSDPWWSFPTNRDIDANIEIWNFFKNYSLSQCLPYGFTFTTQEEIDSFQVNHPFCTEITGYVSINGDDITDLSGLNSLTAIGDNFAIGGIGGSNPLLVDLSGLNNLNSVGGDFHIVTNLSLTSLSGLENLSIIQGGLTIGSHFPFNGNASLTNLSGLENLNTIGGDLKIIANESLTNLSALSNLVSLGGNLIIGSDMENVISNGLLTNLEGLEGLTIIHGDIGIFRNGYLTDLMGLNNITTVEGSVGIAINSLPTLTGLENLSTIGGALEIYGNDALTNISGLNNLTEIGTGLYILNNDNLSECVVQSVCDYLASPNGNIAIGNNAPGCNSPEEVEAGCLFSVDDFSLEETFTIYPNPTSGTATLKLVISDIVPTHSEVICEIYTITGIKIKEMMSEKRMPGTIELEIDLSDLPAGIYYCVMRSKSGKWTTKLIKL